MAPSLTCQPRIVNNFRASKSCLGKSSRRTNRRYLVAEMGYIRDEQTGLLGLHPITHTMSRETDHLIHLRLGGERIQTTAEHPFYGRQAKGWQKAGTLVVGDEVIRADEQWQFAAAMALTAVEHRTEFEAPQVVYNIKVGGAHTYFVGKWMWWVHNANVCVSKIVKEGVEAVKKLLKGELKTGTYKQLDDLGEVGDNLTPHHMPSDAYMKRRGGSKYSRDEGVSVNVEQPHPGTGGRHRQTKTYGGNMTKAEREAYYKMSPAEAMEHDIEDLRKVYEKEGISSDKEDKALNEVRRLNREKYPDIFP